MITAQQAQVKSGVMMMVVDINIRLTNRAPPVPPPQLPLPPQSVPYIPAAASIPQQTRSIFFNEKRTSYIIVICFLQRYGAAARGPRAP
jgi:hypothetical protein